MIKTRYLGELTARNGWTLVMFIDYSIAKRIFLPPAIEKIVMLIFKHHPTIMYAEIYTHKTLGLKSDDYKK